VEGVIDETIREQGGDRHGGKRMSSNRAIADHWGEREVYGLTNTATYRKAITVKARNRLP
jgi:hypothetical protein